MRRFALLCTFRERPAQGEGGQSMSCRATCQRSPTPPRPVTCVACGVSDLHTFYTSNKRGIHLCPACYGSQIERGMAKEGERQVPGECGSRSVQP